MKKISTLLLALTISGCATGPMQKPYLGSDASCIKGDVANFLKFFSSGEAHVNIMEVDGLPPEGSSPYCVAPGKHTIGVSAVNNNKEFNDYLEFDFKPNTTYQLKANLRGISFHFKLLDVTASDHVVLSEFSRKMSGYDSKPVMVPIFIPN